MSARPVSAWHLHGRAGRQTPTHNSWRGVKARCRNPRTFENFLADMGERPQGTTLERIDNDGNYEPDNCRGAARKEQTRNRSINYRKDAHGVK